jgi:hypothetical protein
MHPFEDLESVHSALSRLEKRGPSMVAVLPRQPGTKESRYAHLVGDAPPVAPPVEPTAAADAGTIRGHGNSTSQERMETLASEIAELRQQIAELQAQFATFRKQFE